MVTPTERRQQIIKDIDILGDNVIPRLSRKYGVSEMTIRRDLKALEETGLIKRTYGGAVRWPLAGTDPQLQPRDKRQTLAAAQKLLIARYAAEQFVTDHDIIILEGGTTATAMAQYLAAKEDLTVVTNGIATAEELRRSLPLSAAIIATGGILRPESSTCVGPVAERFFGEFHANRLFLSATGLTLDAGITDPKMLETQVKRAMIASAREVIMLMDGSKFGVRSLMRVIAFDEIHALITDEAAPPEQIAELRSRGVNVIVVPAP
jgi:DeoR/GlpR family transcriptional regulator of sugar metabolism